MTVVDLNALGSVVCVIVKRMDTNVSALYFCGKDKHTCQHLDVLMHISRTAHTDTHDHVSIFIPSISSVYL